MHNLCQLPASEHKVLIANRGEIAVRIIRACRDCGMESIALYADPDAESLYVRMADQAWALPGVAPTDTYLNIEKIIAVAQRAGATMVHPGYGFLSERADFARAVQNAGLIWIGPSPETIEQLGDKVQARKIALAVGAPLVQGSADPVRSAAEVMDFAATYGLPVAIKAAFGGGGRGLKVAWRMEEVTELYHSAVREAQAAFGRGECYVEQYLDRPRHIEAQIMADRQGNVVVIGTRDCSLQRRNQKLVEEAPAPFISDAQREAIHSAARDICAAAGYVGAGTVEFLLSRDGTLSFLEVNTRLQVEHPVTEETAGIDLVIEQLRVALGLPLSVTQTPAPRGHAIEFRINAEDPGRGYLPTPGTISLFEAPSGPGVRLDSGVEAGSVIPGSYDSMMAKLIVTGATREQAIARARRALAEFSIDGVASVLPFHQAVLEEPDFSEDFRVHTRWIETELSERLTIAPRQLPAVQDTITRTWIELEGRRVSLGLPVGLFSTGVISPAQSTTAALPAAGENDVPAPITGILHGWLRDDGDQVAEGETIAVMEAMKMEVPVIAPRNGRLTHQAAAGSSLDMGQVLAVII
ncbi:acetyl/propionyl/methylcrotonyl-CoA carboxylase subunit alpha [Entomohabitans teleogrylli]|uniref:acetyl/propionyl/methylcrotonyl-CoA carboxylase subunit alpha n=1 Tax=Entomohabitans teleogrylli TaxID=1384589 RepID=UPI00073D804C|nr:biotin carboxylase N-terminal domain-containing protein [Entomohabitans teleogrylli]